MNIEIRKLTHSLMNDYLNFFDIEKHSDNIDEHKCYCVCWCSDDHRNSKEKLSTAEKRRELAAQYIKDGKIQGYLAYYNSKAVGWCNANSKSECYNCISWLMFMEKVDKEDCENGMKVKSVYCFTIAPSMRRKGIAAKLLERVCKDAENDGFNFVEAYPKKKLKGIDDFEGPAKMYRKCGFSIHKELYDFFVMRKKI